MAVLVTGGAGYIGSHTCVQLLAAGYEVVIVDNLSNSKPQAVERIRELSGKNPLFYPVDLLDTLRLEAVFAAHAIDAVIHFAGYKAVGESVALPLSYYRNNITGTLNLCEVMKKHGVRKLVFSSSATVYGMPERVPIQEDFPLAATNPYGRTKLMTEEILRDLHRSDADWGIVLLRYFNPAGAHTSGRIGEDPGGKPNNLLPYISQVAVGRRRELHVFGADYPTRDGTGIRDYIHVEDLAAGHLRALDKLATTTGVLAYNLGTGHGFSVLELVRSFEEASGRAVPYTIVGRRPGDVAECYADPAKAIRELGWRATRSVEEMCADAWRWQLLNPNGYAEAEEAPVWKLRRPTAFLPRTVVGGEWA
jgi:UDP-glucose 4-epimerase